MLVPRKLFSSYGRRAELKHFLNLCSAWKKLAEAGKATLDFTLLSAKHPLEEMHGLHSIQPNAFLSELTGFDVETAMLSTDSISAASASNGRAAKEEMKASYGANPAAPINAAKEGSLPNAAADAVVAVNFVESIGIEKEELAGFLEQNFRDFGIPPAGWHHFPSTRSLVSDSYALHSAGASLLEHGKFAGVLAVGWPVFDAGLRLAKECSLPAFCKFSTPSKLEAEIEGTVPHEPVISRELAAIRHGKAILSLDVAGLKWILKNYSPKALASEKTSDFENVLEVLELLSDSAGLMQIVSARHAHPHDRRSAITLLKEARSTLDSHPVSYGEHFVSSKYCAAFNSPLQVKACSKNEISSAKRSLYLLSSLEGPALSRARAKKVFSLVFSDASDSVLQAFSKALASMPDAAFVVRADSPKLAARLKKISGDALVSHRIALMPQKLAGGEATLMAASHAIVFPNPVGNLLHYENALSAVHSARQAGVSTPAIVATAAAPFFIKDAAILPPAPSDEQLFSVLSHVSSGGEFGRRQPSTESLRAWSWNDVALKMTEFLWGRI